MGGGRVVLAVLRVFLGLSAGGDCGDEHDSDRGSDDDEAAIASVATGRYISSDGWIPSDIQGTLRWTG